MTKSVGIYKTGQKTDKSYINYSGLMSKVFLDLNWFNFDWNTGHVNITVTLISFMANDN